MGFFSFGFSWLPISSPLFGVHLCLSWVSAMVHSGSRRRAVGASLAILVASLPMLMILVASLPMLVLLLVSVVFFFFFSMCFAVGEKMYDLAWLFVQVPGLKRQGGDVGNGKIFVVGNVLLIRRLVRV